MILKKKEFFLLIFLIFLQSCSGGRIGNFLESSFNDLEKISKDENLQNNLVNKKILVKENKEINDKKNKKIKKLEKPKNVPENKKILVKENKEINDKKNKKIKKVEKPENFIENKKDINSEKISKQKNIKVNGNIRLDPSVIIRDSKINDYDLLDQKAFSNIIKNLYATGYFSDVKIVLSG